MGRLNFLREKYNIIPEEEYQEQKDLLSTERQMVTDVIPNDYMIHIDVERNYVMSELTLEKLVEADPTKNQMYVQWLLEICKTKFEENLLKVFIDEDLPKTKDYLVLFNSNKRKKRFKEMAANNFAVKMLRDPTNINQYTSIDQLYSVVYPFKERVDVSELENRLDYFVDLGEAVMPVKDEQYTIFIPRTQRASELFDFTSWCTAHHNGSMFKSYCEGDPKPNGDNSDLYVIIDNGFFTGENEKIYQVHFESNQIMDKADRRYDTLKEDILDKSTSVRNFFYLELKSLSEMAYDKYIKSGNKNNTFGIDNCKYIRYLLEFGFGDVLFEIMGDDVPSISYSKLNIPKLPSLKKFTQLKTIHLDEVCLEELDDNAIASDSLEMISIPRNKVTTLPNKISTCKNLRFINLVGNPIERLPEAIKYLDVTRGGSLYKLSLPKSYTDLKTLKTWLPSVEINTF